MSREDLGSSHIAEVEEGFPLFDGTCWEFLAHVIWRFY